MSLGWQLRLNIFHISAQHVDEKMTSAFPREHHLSFFVRTYNLVSSDVRLL